MIISEVLDAIDNINSITIESEINTCRSLLYSYDKMLIIEEYYDGNDINGFKIFQENESDFKNGILANELTLKLKFDKIGSKTLMVKGVYKPNN